MIKTAEMEARLAEVKERIDKALQESLRSHAGLTLVAISKRQPLSLVTMAYHLGLRHFGENQIQEAVPKAQAAPADIIWHFVGHLQKNKVRKCVQHFRYIHSIDSLSLLRRVDRLAEEVRTCPKVFLQVNLALDPDKHGLHPEAVEPVLEAALSMENLECIGLMGIPPVGFNEDRIAEYFQGLGRLAKQMKRKHPDWPGLLSMGMTHDLHFAIKAGSNFVRIGTAIFGART